MALFGSDAHRDESRGFLNGLRILGGLGSLLILLYSLRFRESGDMLRIFGVAMLVAGAALLTGFLLGFIFAIPRVGDGKERGKAAAAGGPGEAHPSPAERRRDPLFNANLVEISDWLTKIIVGVGLVELKSIAHSLGTLSYYLAPGLQPASCAANASCADSTISGQAAGLAIITFYLALGFLMGYIWTMIFFRHDLLKDLEEENRTLDAYRLIVAAEGAMVDGDLEEALNLANQAIGQDPKFAGAVVAKGRILKRKAEKAGYKSKEGKALLNQALALTNQAIVLQPDKGEPLYNKACYLVLLDENTDAVLANLKSAFRLNPALRHVANRPDPDLDDLKNNADYKALINEGDAPGA